MTCLYCHEEIVHRNFLPNSEWKTWTHARTRQFTCGAVPSWYTGKGWPMAIPKERVYR